MIVHEESLNVPTGVPVVKMSNHVSKKFLIVNNHVREIPIQYNPNSTICNEGNEQSVSKSLKIKRKMYKKKNTGYLNNKIIESKCEEQKNSDATHNQTKISESDLEELRTVYRNCKSVMKKIEKKYGHLLDLDHEASPSQLHMRKLDEETEECQCGKNKKIVFDDDGQQKTVDTIENHICPKKSKETQNYRNIEIQYTEDDLQLPDNLQDLSRLLQNPNIEPSLRNQINYKVKSIKEELLNEIKFNKHSLIEKLKSNPDEILAFEGTNLASLPGYS